MIVAAFSLGIAVVALRAALRMRRTLEADRWARTAHTERMPGESNRDLVRRIAVRYGVGR